MAQLFGTMACLTITAALIAISLVIFVFPNTTVPAVRAWWATRILFAVSLVCVLLTFTLNANSFCASCRVSTGSVLNALNVLLLISLMVISFWIQVTGQPPLAGLGDNDTATKDLSGETEMPELSKVDDMLTTPSDKGTPHLEEVPPEVH